MKLRFLHIVGVLLLVPALLTGCDDDPSGPTDEIYSLQSVVLEGDTLSAPAVLYNGPVRFTDGSSAELRYELRRGTLLLLNNGRYEVSGQYRVEFPQQQNRSFTQGAFEDGTYTRTATGITFTPAAGSDRILGPTATLQNGIVSVTAEDPLFNNFSYTLRFGR